MEYDDGGYRCELWTSCETSPTAAQTSQSFHSYLPNRFDAPYNADVWSTCPDVELKHNVPVHIPAILPDNGDYGALWYRFVSEPQMEIFTVAFSWETERGESCMGLKKIIKPTIKNKKKKALMF